MTQIKYAERVHNVIGGVIANMVASSVVDRGFEPQ